MSQLSVQRPEKKFENWDQKESKPWKLQCQRRADLRQKREPLIPGEDGGCELKNSHRDTLTLTCRLALATQSPVGLVSTHLGPTIGQKGKKRQPEKAVR